MTEESDPRCRLRLHSRFTVPIDVASLSAGCLLLAGVLPGLEQLVRPGRKRQQITLTFHVNWRERLKAPDFSRVRQRTTHYPAANQLGDDDHRS